MKQIFIIQMTVLFILAGCGNNTNSEKVNLLNNKIDSLTNQIKQFQKNLAVKAVNDSKSANKDTFNTVKSIPKPVMQKKVSPVKTKSPDPHFETVTPNNPTLVSESDTTYYYYTVVPKKISVKISPWQNSRRKILFYNTNGNLSYSLEDIKMSFHIISTIKKFHDNGAAELVEIGNYPDASMYWYETTITFDTNNNPLLKTEVQKPETSLEQLMNGNYKWDIKNKLWLKQEIKK
jgi:hypothetical protein